MGREAFGNAWKHAEIYIQSMHCKMLRVLSPCPFLVD